MIMKLDLKLDHITVVARTLDEGADHIRQMLGIDMPQGGAHPAMGTHNRLLSLGESTFLELIAVDQQAAAPDRPRWFDLDRFDGPPVLATWVLGTDDIPAALSTAHPDSGEATPITRGDLSWLISVPKDGSMPVDGAFPALIEWPSGPHPASRMPDLGCRIQSLSISHPDAETIEVLIGNRIDRTCITISKGPKSILAQIETPNGMKVLS
ncbi:polyphosphate kinase [Roseobacter cerasinus]|uniref:Polyphosphate kinase n=1 Tax=Roseobacter cerasinus TaxID=2602289 RepID=A0A640VJ40_9RHOB|nr:VOC family protein [Roseobacter cerasinus]GFE48353.1 polyphosphate kinase [Roseobacter cerasinus]